MNRFDAERERIGRLLEQGLMTRREHGSARRMILGAERRAARDKAAEAERRRESAQRYRAKQKLRRALTQSLEGDAR